MSKRTIGWREWVTLPDLSPTLIKAKVDTGARTSALHAFDLRVERGGDGPDIAHFLVHPEQRTTRDTVPAHEPIVDYRRIRSSDGRVEQRPVIRTPIRLGDRRWAIELSLTRRDQMGFRLLLGRSAVRRRFVVDPGRSYLRSEPTAADPPDATGPDSPDLEQA